MTTTDPTLRDVLVVGAGAAGLSTVEALRRRGHRGALTLLGGEPWAPYDRPPLSKQVLAGTWEPGRTRLRPDDALADLNVALSLGDPAVALDPVGRAVTTAAGRTLRADAVVVATGARARRLPGQDDLGGVHVVRTLDDALALRRDLLAASRLVVVGDGVLGTEVAATGRALGLEVTLTGPQPAPMSAQLGPLVAGVLAELHRERGVRLRPGVATRGLLGAEGRVGGVALETGEVLPADVVVVALGAAPDTAWLARSGLTLDDGVLCDSRCRAAAGIWAVGDVARFVHEGLGRTVRLENRTHATEQAGAVAADILGAGRPYTPVPYLWTDQYDSKLQVHGLTGGDTTATVVEGDLALRRFVVAYHRDGELVGALGWGMPKQTVALRRELAAAFAPVPTAPAA